jgi:hypothetical protein
MGTLLDFKENTSEVLLSQRLESDSSRRAWYSVSLAGHPGGGYLITRKSGASGSAGCAETWFRWTLQDAMQKYQATIQRKLDKKRGRIYTESNLALF